MGFLSCWCWEDGELGMLCWHEAGLCTRFTFKEDIMKGVAIEWSCGCDM